MELEERVREIEKELREIKLKWLLIEDDYKK